MAANSLVRDPEFGANEMMTSTQANALQTQAAQSVNRHSTASGTINFPLVPIGESNTPFTYNIAYGVLYLSNSASHTISFALDRLPDKHLFLQTTIKLKPATGHTVAPNKLPWMRVYKVALDGTVTTIGTATYTFTTVAEYEAGVELVLYTPTVIDLSAYRYIVELFVESGTYSLTGTVVQSLAILFNIDTDEGGPDCSFWLNDA